MPLILKLLVPLVLGIITAHILKLDLPLKLVLILFFGLCIFAIPLLSKVTRLNMLFGWMATSLFFVLGIVLINLHRTENRSDYFSVKCQNKKKLFQVRIIERPVEKNKSMSCVVSVLGVENEKTTGNAMVYFEKDSCSRQLKNGDLLQFYSRFQPIPSNTNPYAFDYSKHLAIEGITHQSYVRKDNWKKLGNDIGALQDFFSELRETLEDLLSKSTLSKENQAVAKALLLGSKTSLDRDVMTKFSGAGAMHVLAVSGLHVGIVMLLLSYLLKPLKRIHWGKYFFIVLVLLFIWSYALLTGFSPSVLRAAVMFSFVLIGNEIERENSVYQSIFVSAFVLLIIDPFVLFKVGFQLSYLAVLGIVFMQPKIYNLWYTKFFLFDKIWQISSVSIAAQIATFPLGVYYFNQFPNYFLLSNLIVIPLAFAVLLIGILYFSTSWISMVGDFFLFLLDILLSIMNFGVGWINDLPNSVQKGIAFYWFETVWVYLLIFTFSIAFYLRNKRWFISGLFGALIWLCFIHFNQKRISESNQLIAYQVNNYNAIDVFYGRSNLFIASKELKKDNALMGFSIYTNRYYRLNSKHEDCYMSLDSLNDVLRVGKQTLLVFDGRKSYDSIPRTDIIYFHHEDYLPENLLEQLEVSRTTVVLGANNSYGLRNFLNNQKNFTVHDIASKGAYTLDF